MSVHRALREKHATKASYHIPFEAIGFMSSPISERTQEWNGKGMLRIHAWCSACRSAKVREGKEENWYDGRENRKAGQVAEEALQG